VRRTGIDATGSNAVYHVAERKLSSAPPPTATGTSTVQLPSVSVSTALRTYADIHKHDLRTGRNGEYHTLIVPGLPDATEPVSTTTSPFAHRKSPVISIGSECAATCPRSMRLTTAPVPLVNAAACRTTTGASRCAKCTESDAKGSADSGGDAGAVIESWKATCLSTAALGFQKTARTETAGACENTGGQGEKREWRTDGSGVGEVDVDGFVGG
jgi:hypothetical protein